MRRKLIPIILLFLALSGKAQEATTDSIGDGTLRLLTIGNSFSQDAVEQYLYELAQEAGVKMIIGNAYRGGQSLESHWRDLTEANASYEYRKVVDGVRTNTPGALLSNIITDEPWQVISFQQASHYSGLKGTIEPYLTNLIHYTDSAKTSQDIRYGFHMTWAYSKDSTHGGFANYSNQQTAMYDSIISTVQDVMEQHPELSFLVPNGTAIQNARTSYLGDNMNRDGYHLDLKIGRYTAACTWLEVLTGKSSVGLSYRPSGVDEVAARTCQEAAHKAVQNPWSVSSLSATGFNVQNDIKPSGLIKLNFGATKAKDESWNNITPDTRTYTWITDAKQNVTGITLTCTDNFIGTNTNGSQYTTTKMMMPAEVSTSCVWGYAAGHFGGQNPKSTGAYTLGHLNPELEYDFTIYSSRDNCRDFRETVFLVQGEESQAGNVDAANNASETVLIKDVKPTADGRITIMVTPGPKNTNANKFYYLNAITIKAHK